MRATTERFVLSLARPLETADGRIDAREGFLVRVRDESSDADLTGFGEATPLPGWTESLEACHDGLDAAIETLATDGREDALSELDGLPAARHGLSLALLDLDAKRAGKPLYQSLGHNERRSESETITVNDIVGDGTVSETVDEARAAVAEGFDCLKVKVGARSPGVDAARLRAVAEEVGESVTLRVDANGSWTRGQAMEAIESFPTLEYVEQPLSPDDFEGHSGLREKTTIALDETLAERDVTEVIGADVADVLVCKPMVLGGIDRVRDVIESATKEGIDPVVTTTIDGVVARMGAIHLAASLGVERPCGLATATRLATDLAPDPAPVDGGRVHVPQSAGIGVELPGSKYEG